jgi:hypothetical protein
VALCSAELDLDTQMPLFWLGITFF